MAYAVLLVLGLIGLTFLMGSIPWGVIISRAFYHKDIRNEGSGNIGTTNALRSMGKAGGAAVFLLDFGKGLLAGFLGTVFAGLVRDALASAGLQALAEGGAALCLGAALLGCVWGHIFSPWLKFKGGKGIAVAVGCLFFVFGPAGALIEIALFAVLVIATRYVSVGSLAAAVACPFIACWIFYGHWVAVAFILVAAGTVIWAHRGNLARLRAGTENRIGAKREQAEG